MITDKTTNDTNYKIGNVVFKNFKTQTVAYLKELQKKKICVKFCNFDILSIKVKYVWGSDRDGHHVLRQNVDDSMTV